MTKMEVTEVSYEKPKKLLGMRHLQVLMLFFAMFLGFGMRVNMSLAIVAMTDPSNEDSFDWSVQVQSVILSSFFWVYVVFQFPGGELATRFGGRLLVTLCIGINSIVLLLMPTCAYYGGWQMVCACRVIQGLSQGVLMPCMHYLLGKWAPLEEKNRLGTFVYSGAQFGTAIQLLVSGFIADSWGWPAIFYVGGGIGAAWTVLYILIGADSPQTSKLISLEEKLYIQSSLGQIGGHKKYKTPWKSLWTSLPFISLIIANCGQNWGLWTLLTEIPSYMSQVLGVNIKANGVMSALPYIAVFIMGFPCGFLSDLVISKKWMSINTTRKISNSIGFFGPAIALIGLSYAPADVTITVTILTLVVGLNAGHYTGYLLVHIDMAPNFAGTMMGITNGFANIISILAPLAVGLILKDETDPQGWRFVFYLAAAFYVFSNLFYVIFGTSDRQPWNEPVENKKEKDLEIEKESEKTDKTV